MAGQLWSQPLFFSSQDGPTLTAASAASMLPTNSKPTLSNNFFAGGVAGGQPQKVMRVTAWGRISCVVTTPGTARFDFRCNGVVMFDTTAIALNTTAQTTVGWKLVVELIARAVGPTTSANCFGMGTWESQALVGSSATAGVGGVCVVPFNAAPAVGGGFDSTIANPFDIFFTQTVATGSLTCHGVLIEDVA